MNGVDVVALRAAAEVATPGPWAHSEVMRGHVYVGGCDVLVGNPRNAEFAAVASPDVVLALLDQLHLATSEMRVAEATSQASANAHMRAAAKNRALLDRVSELEAVVERVRGLADKEDAEAAQINSTWDPMTKRYSSVRSFVMTDDLRKALDGPQGSQEATQVDANEAEAAAEAVEHFLRLVERGNPSHAVREVIEQVRREQGNDNEEIR